MHDILDQIMYYSSIASNNSDDDYEKYDDSYDEYDDNDVEELLAY